MEYHIIGGDGKVYGPKPESEIRDWIQEGRLDAESRICRAGGEDWLTLDRLPEFAMDLSSAGTSDTAPQPVAGGSSSPVLEPLPGPQSPPLPGAQPGPVMPQPGYPQKPPGSPGQIPQPVMMSPTQTTNPMAITGMITGIISLFSLCCCIGWPFIVLGIVFSCIGLSQIKANPHQQGKGMAIAGLVCSIVGIVLVILSFVLNIAAATFSP